MTMYMRGNKLLWLFKVNQMQGPGAFASEAPVQAVLCMRRYVHLDAAQRVGTFLHDGDSVTEDVCCMRRGQANSH